MKIEIWSDVMCPFCYIGKRRFEAALSQLNNDHQDKIEIIWKSFQLDPDMKTDSSQTINAYLAERKGWTMDYAKQVNAHVTAMAKEVGLTYDFEKAIVANSFNAHRVSHLAKKFGLSDAMEEVLFKAYFTEGKNIDDKATLIELATSIGLKKEAVEIALFTDQYAEDVVKDMQEAQQIGVRGVPFFVIDRKYAVSGAQPVEVFLETLQKANAESKLNVNHQNGNSCSIDGNCN